jgi:transcriptional regulator with XRE-family HTH domain
VCEGPHLLASGITTTELARAAGLGRAHLAAIERGVHPITSTHAVDLAGVLDVPAD